MFIAENIDGKIRFVDPQSGRLGYEPFSRVSRNRVWAVRIDNCDLVPEILDEFVSFAGGDSDGNL